MSTWGTRKGSNTGTSVGAGTDPNSPSFSEQSTPGLHFLTTRSSQSRTWGTAGSFTRPWSWSPRLLVGLSTRGTWSRGQWRLLHSTGSSQSFTQMGNGLKLKKKIIKNKIENNNFNIAILEKVEENSTRSRRTRLRRETGDTDSVLDTVQLQQLVKTLLRHDDGWPFSRPVSRREAPDYRHVVSQPMDLETIRQRLDDMRTYSTNQQVLEDIALVFQNCEQYNPPETEERQCGARLEQYFIQLRDQMGF